MMWNNHGGAVVVVRNAVVVAFQNNRRTAAAAQQQRFLTTTTTTNNKNCFTKTITTTRGILSSSALFRHETSVAAVQTWNCCFTSGRIFHGHGGEIRSFTTTSSSKPSHKDGNGGGGEAPLPSSSSTSNGNSDSSSSSNWWIRIGWTLLGLVAIDQALQLKQQWEDEEKRQVLYEMQLQADAEDSNQADFDATLPTLFECKLLHVEPSLDGTKMLTRRSRSGSSAGSRNARRGVSASLQKGDVVEVLQANVGPNQAYHLCRVKPSTKETEQQPPLVGWYPTMFLERVE